MTKIESPVPVLQVFDVERSIDWYGGIFGFEADPFPERAPYSFAILRRDCAEVMLQCNDSGGRVNPQRGWAVYLRMAGGQLLEFAEAVRKKTKLAREPERMSYGQVEFEVVDPDGHVICVAEPLPETGNVPRAREA